MKPNTKEAAAKRGPGRPRKPKPAGTRPAESIAPPSAPEAAPVQAAPPPAVAAPPETVATVAAVETVEVAGVECPARFYPLEGVLGLLGQDVLDRIDRLHGSPSISAHVSRMRMTDGRGTPVYFTVENGVPTFNHGCEALAAAKGLAAKQVFVVSVPALLSDELQNHLVMVARQWSDEDAAATRR